MTRRAMCVLAVAAALLTTGCLQHPRTRSKRKAAAPSAAKRPELAATSSPPVPDLPVPQGFRLDESRSRTFASAGSRYVDHVYEGNADKYTIARFYKRQMPISRWTGMFCAMAIGSLPFWRQLVEVGRDYGESTTQIILGGVMLLLFIEQIVRYRTQGAIRHIAGSLLAVCYLGVCSAVVLGIRIHIGMRGFILFVTVVKATDIGAYFIGTFLGRHKLAPRLSAGKTWEGLAGGLALAVVCSLAIGAQLGRGLGPLGQGTMYWWNAVLFALLLGLFGQVADLCESTLKRDAGLKDSGRGVPAFGGVLDVVDSPLLAAPVAYVLLALFR